MNSQEYFECAMFQKLLAHSKPDLRIICEDNEKLLSHRILLGMADPCLADILLQEDFVSDSVTTIIIPLNSEEVKLYLEDIGKMTMMTTNPLIWDIIDVSETTEFKLDENAEVEAVINEFGMNNLVLVSEEVKPSKHHKTIHEVNPPEKSYCEDEILAPTLKSASSEIKFSSLKDHFSKDEESGNFVCKYCCLSFQSIRKDPRRDHLMSKHQDKVTGLLNSGFWAKHFKSDKETGNCICLHCSKVISSGPNSNKRHTLIFHSDKITEEDLAKPSFLWDHFSNDDTKNYLCQHCGKSFNHFQNAKKHLISYHTDTIDESKVEKATLKKVKDRKNELNRMEVEMKNKKIMKETCPHCGKSYTAKTCLKKHLKHFEANGECVRRVTCSQCGKILKGETSLKSHIRTYHEEKEKEWEDCVECGKRLQRVSMKHHIFVQHSDAFVPFQCQHCEYPAKSKAELKRHIKIKHEEANPVNCPWCGNYVKCLERHLRRTECNIPENERKEVKTTSCDICLKKFTSKCTSNINLSLEKHKKTVHEKIKDVHCERCDYKTYTKNNLYVHVKRMHEGRPYREQCPKCPKMVVNIEWHIRTYHPV